MTDQLNSPTTTGGIIDALFEIREQKRELARQDRALSEKTEALERLLFERLDAEETTKAAGRAASVSVSEEVVPSIEDWESFYEYVRKNDAFHLLQRRLNNAAWRETVELEGSPPQGTQPFTKRKLNLRKN